jgi:hypothetical protein
MKPLILLASAAALVSFAPAPSHAQSLEVGVPGVAGVRIGEPGYRRYHRDYDRRRFREREVRYGGSCKTVTVERDDGSVKRIRRCD